MVGLSPSVIDIVLGSPSFVVSNFVDPSRAAATQENREAHHHEHEAEDPRSCRHYNTKDHKYYRRKKVLEANLELS